MTPEYDLKYERLDIEHIFVTAYDLKNNLLGLSKKRLETGDYYASQDQSYHCKSAEG